MGYVGHAERLAVPFTENLVATQHNHLKEVVKQICLVLDTAKVLFCKRLLGEKNAFMATMETAANSSLPSPHNVLDEGWALRSTKTSKVFFEKQRRFFEKKFTIGETTGRKLDPVTVARQMRVVRGTDGQ